MKIKEVSIIIIITLILLTALGVGTISFLHKDRVKPDLVQVNDFMKTLEEEGENSPKLEELKERYGLDYSYLDGNLLVYSDQSTKQESRDRMLVVILVGTMTISIGFILYHTHYMQKNIPIQRFLSPHT